MTTEEIAETAFTTLNLKRSLGATEEALRKTLLSAMRAVAQEERERCIKIMQDRWNWGEVEIAKLIREGS